MAAAGEHAAVRAAGGAGIARKHGKPDPVTGLLEFRTQSGVLFHGILFALFAFEPAGFSHREGVGDFGRAIPRDGRGSRKGLFGRRGRSGTIPAAPS